MGRAGQDSRRARLARQVIIDVSVLATIGVVLGILAPLGTGSMSLAARIGYWVVLALAGYLFYKPIGAFVIGLRDRLDLPGWFLWSVSVLVATVPMATLVWFVNHAGGPVRVPTIEIALSHYFAVGVVGAVVTVLFNLLPATGPGRDQPPRPAASSDAATVPFEPLQPPNPLLDQLPAALGSDVIALEMEDHYVRVHTALGSALVLMRLRDATAHLAHVEGREVHRSWWVARLAVEDVKREGRNVRLVLPRGIEAPVARARVNELRDAGWI